MYLQSAYQGFSKANSLISAIKNQYFVSNKNKLIGSHCLKEGIQDLCWLPLLILASDHLRSSNIFWDTLHVN